MKRMREHPPLDAVVTTLAQAVMSQPLFSNRTISIAFPAPMGWCRRDLLIEISQGLGLSYPRHFRDRIALPTTPHTLVAAMVAALRIDRL